MEIVGDILVAEDSKLLLQLLRDALMAHQIGSQVVACPNGEALLALVEERLRCNQRAALYVLDIVMPGLSGIEVAHLLRPLERSAGVPPAPILFYSTRVLDSEITQAVGDCWPARYVHKEPASRADQLAMAIVKLLDELRETS